MKKYTLERFLQLVLALDDNARQELYYVLQGYQLAKLIDRNSVNVGKEN